MSCLNPSLKHHTPLGFLTCDWNAFLEGSIGAELSLDTSLLQALSAISPWTSGKCIERTVTYILSQLFSLYQSVL